MTFFLKHHYHFQRTISFVGVIRVAAKIGVEKKNPNKLGNSSRVYVCVFRPDNGPRRRKPPQNWCFNWRSVSLVLWSHWAYSALLGSWLVGLNGYLSCEWWRLQPIWSEWTSFYVRKRGIRVFRRELAVSRCCVSHKPGSSPRVTLILSSPPLSHPHISKVKPVVEIWQQHFSSPDGCK